MRRFAVFMKKFLESGIFAPAAVISFILFCCFVQITTELKAEPAITSIGGVTVVSNGSWPEIVTDTSQNEEVFVDSVLISTQK